MELCTFLLYTHLMGVVLPHKKQSLFARPGLVYISEGNRPSSSSFVQRVERETSFAPKDEASEYVIPEDNIAHASAIGIALGMLQAMKVRSADYGQSRLNGLAYTLVMSKAIRRRARRLRQGDRFRLEVGGKGKIHLAINQSTRQSRALAQSKIMSLRPAVKKQAVFNIGNADPYVQEVARQSEVIEAFRQVQYIVHEDDIPHASGMGAALGMLHAMKINSQDFGQSRLQGLALSLVLKKEIRRKLHSFHKGDVFTLQVSALGKISLAIGKAAKANDGFGNDPVNDNVASKKQADEMMASYAPVDDISGQQDEEEDEFDAAFKPENIIKNNIKAIINETVAGLKVKPALIPELRQHLSAFLTGWSQTAVKVDDRFVQDFIGVIAQDLMKSNPKAVAPKVREALVKGLKKEHEVYNSKEEALRETAKEILATVKEMKEESGK